MQTGNKLNIGQRRTHRQSLNCFEIDTPAKQHRADTSHSQTDTYTYISIAHPPTLTHTYRYKHAHTSIGHTYTRRRKK